MAVYSPTPGARAGYASLAIRVVLSLLGAVAMVGSAFLDWVERRAATELPLRGLIDTARNEGPFSTSIGLAIIVLGLLAIVGLAPRSGWLTRLAGALGIALVVLFVIGLYQRDLTLADLAVGGWVALIGSIVALVGGFFGTRTVVVAPPATPATTVVEP